MTRPSGGMSRATRAWRRRMGVVSTTLILALPLPSAHAAAAVGGEAVADADGPALLREWAPPVYPAMALKQRESGIVDVRLVVDAQGRVTAARALEGSDEAFVDAALAAVRSWGFAPAIEQGQPVACCLDTQVIFSPAIGQEKPSPGKIPPERQTFAPAPRVSPQPRSAPSGDYPAVLVERKLPGTVRFACTITREGNVVAPRVLGASHVEFVLPALDALTRWEFTAGREGDLAVAAPVEGVVTFDNLFVKIEEVLAANGITDANGQPPEMAALPSFIADPVWPIEPLLKGEGGSATVEFVVTGAGTVTEVKVREATQPEFGAALRAAVETWGFNRLVGVDPGARMRWVKREDFRAVPLDATTGGEAFVRLVLAMRRGEIGGAKGLDEKLTPLYRVSPEYPAALIGAESPTGRAEVEFVIDRTGRARLPRVVSATQPEFGWAAATAVSQWVFKAPRRGGQPVDVRVRVPFEFAAPRP